MLSFFYSFSRALSLRKFGHISFIAGAMSAVTPYLYMYLCVPEIRMPTSPQNTDYEAAHVPCPLKSLHTGK